MSLIENIKTGYLKRQATVEKKRVVNLKRPDKFLKILLILNSADDQLIKSAALKFQNAEINQVYLRSTRQDNSGQFQYSVHPTDFNLTGHLKNDKLKKLLDYEFDLVIDLSADSVFLDYFLRNLKSTLVIGVMNSVIHDQYDLFFEKDQNAESFLDMIVTQLNQLIPNGHQ